MRTPENFHEAFDVRLLGEHARENALLGRHMVKLGFASFIQDEAGNVLVASHEARDGEFEQGALGPVMETFGYVPERGEFGTETPAEVFQRSLVEEIKGFDQVDFEKAGFYFDRPYPVLHQEWSSGSLFAWAVNAIIRVRHPEVLERDERCSDEILSTRFMPVDAILKGNEPKRPGYAKWLKMMQRAEALPGRRIAPDAAPDFTWMSFPPSVMRDVRHPFTGLAS